VEYMVAQMALKGQLQPGKEITLMAAQLRAVANIS